ncbi:MAG: GTPase Era [Deltaproteobacteria bacterium]|nr:GTPase Era [Deltaproteobacteria bacterium]
MKKNEPRAKGPGKTAREAARKEKGHVPRPDKAGKPRPEKAGKPRAGKAGDRDAGQSARRGERRPEPKARPTERERRARRARELEAPRIPRGPSLPWLKKRREDERDRGGPISVGGVAIIGRPNVGKSTLLNQLLGQKIAATTHKPQTTRKNILGVLNPSGAQILLLDTPGFHRAKGPLNRFMVAEARRGIADADVVALVVEARDDGDVTPGNEALLSVLEHADKPVVLVVNKIDRVRAKSTLLPLLEAYGRRLGERMVAAVPISAMRRDGLERLVEELARALPKGQPVYDDDFVTDAPERSIVAELIREKLILETQEELPYSAHVLVEAFEDSVRELPTPSRFVRIAATIHVERLSQKKIIVGKGAERLKAIGTRARLEVERFLGARVYLDLHVRVTDGWSSRPLMLAELGLAKERVAESEILVADAMDALDPVDDLVEDLQAGDSAEDLGGSQDQAGDEP